MDVFYKKRKKAKKIKKNEKKVLTTEKCCGILRKLSRRAAAKRSLKIEQQEISTKQKQVRNTNLVDRVYILKKVKEAKIK